MNRIGYILIGSLSVAVVFLSVVVGILRHNNSMLRGQLDSMRTIEAFENIKPSAVRISEAKQTTLSLEEQQKRHREPVSGIYEFGQSSYVHGIDLRSDGTGISYGRIKQSSNKQNQRKITWSYAGDTIYIGDLKYKVEGYDLIDSDQNRWIRESF